MAITALSIIAFHFFNGENWTIKLPIFIFLFSGVNAIEYTVAQNIAEKETVTSSMGLFIVYICGSNRSAMIKTKLA